MAEKSFKDRVNGLVYGQFTGDAFGTTYEFLSAESVERKMTEVSQNFAHFFSDGMFKLPTGKESFIPVIGGGPFGLAIGQVTDDTELWTALVQGVIDHSIKSDCNEFDPNVWRSCAERYSEWYKSGPFDIGTTTSGSLCGTNPDDIKARAQSRNMKSKSNGCLMRSSAMGVIGATLSLDQLKELVTNDCILTNPNPVCIDGVFVFNVAIRCILLGGTKEEAYAAAVANCTTDEIRACLDMARTTAEKIPVDGTFARTDSHYQGYIGVAIQNAFYELLNGTSFYESIKAIVLRGGDTDTTACIAGSLLGAYYGVDEIPNQWRYAVDNCETDRFESWELIKPDRIEKYIDFLASFAPTK